MEEIQSLWEVPAVAHFCYVFRSAFNLIFFEIAELESALLNIQDPDMSISLDQLVIRLLQGCFDEESVTEGNWEEKLHELFNENCDDDEQNLFDDSQNFFQLTPRSKIEVLLRLCELRLDVEGALEDIKNIPSEDMQAKCMGKDSQNNNYWYFCDERLYKEDSSSGKKVNQKKKEVKNATSKSHKSANTREKRTKVNNNIDQSWTVACFNVSDWEKLVKTFSKSKSTLEKELAKAIKEHLPLVEERVSEKDRLLRKRFMELAPKRTSSRISKVQAKKKLEELKAQEEARLAKEEADKEQARKEALKLKEEKESRQKRAEMRHKAVEERANRAKLREMVKDVKSEDSNSSDEQDSNVYRRNQYKSVRSKIRRNLHSEDEQSDEDSDSKKYSDNDYKPSKASHQRTSKRKESTQYESLAQCDKDKRYVRTYSKIKVTRDDQTRSSSRLQNKPKTVKYHFDTDESKGSDSDESTVETDKNEVSTRLQQRRLTSEDRDESDEDSNESDEDSNSSNESNSDAERDEIHNMKNEDYISMQTNSKTSTISNSNKSQGCSLNLPRVTLYKTTVLKGSSDTPKWNAVLNSKGQKLHILNGSCDNLSSKKLKLEERKLFQTSTPNLKSSLLKENHIYQPVRQTPFITYGKIIPSPPSIVRLDFRKPPNHQVSS